MLDSQFAPGTRSLLNVSACPHPFEQRRIDWAVPAGLSIAEIVDLIQPDPVLRLHGVAYIGEHMIPRQRWRFVRPKPGAALSIRLLPSGGNGARIGIMIGIAVLAIVAAVAAPYLAPFIGYAATSAVGVGLGMAAGAIVSVGGTLLLNHFLPPPTPELSSGYGTSSDKANRPSYAITGARNRADPWGKVPFVLGRFRVTPPYAAMPYREIVGGEVYWRAIFAISHGPVALEDPRIGETPVANFEGVEAEIRRGYWYTTDKGSFNAVSGLPVAVADFGDKWTCTVAGSVQGVTYRVGDTITYNGLYLATDVRGWDRNSGKTFELYPRDVYEEALVVAVKFGVPDIRTTQIGADEISIELIFERGLVYIDTKGNKKAQLCNVRIEQSPAGANTWTTVIYKTITGRQTTPLFWGHRWYTANYGAQPADKKYDVRVTRVSTNYDEQRRFGNFTWVALRTITATRPVPVPHVTLLAIRIKASGQLQGSLDEYNVIARTIARDWDEPTGNWVWRRTSSPASLFRHVLQHPARERPADDAQIDLEKLKYWHAYTETTSHWFHGVIEAKTSLWDVLVKIASVGHAMPTLRDLKFSVMIDEPKTSPVRLFTPRNSWDYEGEMSHEPIPHAYRVGYVDYDRDFRADEVVVYDDGYDAATATRVDRVEFVGITNRTSAWREGRFHLAQQRLRREVHRITTDFEHLACERGDLVALQHDVIAVGLGSARIAGRTDDGARALTVTLDAPMVMEGGKSYGFRARRLVAGATRTDLYAVATVAGEQATLTFTAPPLLSMAPSVGDLVSFGEYDRETLRVLVRDIEPRTDLTARLTLIAEGAGVHTADTGPIPAWDPVVTAPRALPAPVVTAIRSDDTVLLVTASRALIERVVFTLAPIGIDGTRLYVLMRPTGTDTRFDDVPVQQEGPTTFAITGVEARQAYDFRLIRTHPDYLSSPATALNGYTVLGRSAPPQALQNFTIAAVGGGALLRWDLPADIDVQVGGWIAVRHSPLMEGALWSDSTSIARSIGGDQTHVYMPLKPGTYFARAYDSDGRYGPVASATSKQANVLAFSPVGELIEDPLFLGEKSYCEVDGSALRMLPGDFDLVEDVDSLADWDTGADGIVPVATYDFAAGLDFGTVKRVRLTSWIMLTAVNTYDLIDARTTPIDDWEDIDGTEGAQVDAAVWGRLTDDDPAGTPTWGACMRVDSADVTCRAVGQIECRMTSSDPTINLNITELRLKAEEVL